jgi:hypothetical protein
VIRSVRGGCGRALHWPQPSLMLVPVVLLVVACGSADKVARPDLLLTVIDDLGWNECVASSVKPEHLLSAATFNHWPATLAGRPAAPWPPAACCVPITLFTSFDCLIAATAVLGFETLTSNHRISTSLRRRVSC